MSQTEIKGYRQLSEAEVAVINEIKAHGAQLEALVERLWSIAGVDGRWIAIGKTDLQTGLMALTRAVAKPTSF